MVVVWVLIRRPARQYDYCYRYGIATGLLPGPLVLSTRRSSTIILRGCRCFLLDHDLLLSTREQGLVGVNGGCCIYSFKAHSWSHNDNEGMFSWDCLLWSNITSVACDVECHVGYGGDSSNSSLKIREWCYNEIRILVGIFLALCLVTRSLYVGNESDGTEDETPSSLCSRGRSRNRWVATALTCRRNGITIVDLRYGSGMVWVLSWHLLTLLW